MEHRIDALRTLMQADELPAMLVTSAANRRYLSGFTGSNGALLITHDAAYIFTDSRYLLQVARQAPDFTLREIGVESPLPNVLAETTNDLGLNEIGFEADKVTVAEYEDMCDALDNRNGTPDGSCELAPIENMIESLRSVKDDDEIATLRQAIAITDAAIAAVLPNLRPDMTEKQAAWLLEVALREGGADALSFPIIVAAGPNAALPHATPGDEPLGEGRPIIIDMGGQLGGYHADLTRTVVLGEPDERFWEVYDVVLAAQRKAITDIRADLTTLEADALARNAISEAGFGDQFGHGLGHGVGLDIHEEPSMRRAVPEGEEPQRLQAGNVVSIEPGIYIEGWGGVRIEDLVLITPQGCEVLSQAPKLRD